MANPATFYIQDLYYKLVQRTDMLNTFNTNFRQDFANAKSVVVPDLTSNIGTDIPANEAALLTAPTITAGDITGITWERKLWRAYGSLELIDIIEDGGGRNADLQLQNDLISAAERLLDAQFASVLTGGTYNTANDNSITKGTASSKFISNSFPYVGTGDGANDLVAEGLEEAALKLGEKNVLTGDMLANTGPAPAPVVAVMPLGLANKVVNTLADKGVLQRPGDIAGQAIRDRGIMSSEYWQGRAYGCDILGTNALSAPNGGGDWKYYVYPSNSAVAGWFRVENVFEYMARDQKLLKERLAWGRWAGRIMRQEHVIQVSIKSQ